VTAPPGRGERNQPGRLVPEPPAVEEGGTDAQATTTPEGGGSRLVRDNLSVAAGTALSRVTGVIRLVALYVAVEASLRDAYLLANNTPNIIYELILGGVLTATLVPLFTTHLEQADEEATSAVVSVALLALLVLTGLTFATAPLLIALYGTNPGPGVDPDTLRAVGTNLSFLFAPQVLFYGLMAVGSSLLNARRRFFAAAWAPVLNNVVVITMLLSVPLVIDGDRTLDRAADDRSLRLLLGIGTTVGVATMALALWPALRRAGVRLRFRPDWRHPSVRRALTLSGWTIGYVVANQVAAQVVNVLAEPGSGDVSNYQVAFMFFQLPHGLLAVSLMTTFQPDLARAVARHDPETFNRRLLLGLRLLGLVIVPAAVGYLVLPRGFAAGAVDSGLIGGGTDAVGIAQILSAFALGLIGFSAYLFVLRGFYALGDTRTPFLLNCGENAVNIVVAVALVGRYGVEGLAWSYAVAYCVAAVVALAVLLRRMPGFDLRSLVDSYLRLAAAATVMGVAVAGVMALAGDASSTAVIAGAVAAIVVGAAVYGATVFGLGVPQAAGVRRGRMP
jgi:putative peptidoglycan lipid II flippase